MGGKSHFNKEVIEMKHNDVYESCKSLAMLYGETKWNYSNCEHAIYMDSFGCDLQIFYADILFLGVGERRKSVIVFLGGREVYSFHEDYPDSELFVKGHWTRLVGELSRYEYDLRVGRGYVINGTLLELCRREAIRNREFFNKYRDMCSFLAKKQGICKKVLDAVLRYEIEKTIDEHRVEIYFTETLHRARMDSEDEIELLFDGKRVFVFHSNSSDVGGLFDEKGEYIPGEWEKILERLQTEI